MAERPWVTPGQLRVQREATADAYLVHILVTDGKTDEVQVTPLGRSLAISRSASAETVQEDNFDEGRGYQRSFSFSRGALSRRIALPPDADLSAMTREVKDGTITLRIPRSARRDWGDRYGPSEPTVPGGTPIPRAPATPLAPSSPPAQPPASQL
jgi:HSP20 family molecular chaperone IbpA